MTSFGAEAGVITNKPALAAEEKNGQGARKGDMQKKPRKGAARAGGEVLPLARRTPYRPTSCCPKKTPCTAKIHNAKRPKKEVHEKRLGKEKEGSQHANGPNRNCEEERGRGFLGREKHNRGGNYGDPAAARRRPPTDSGNVKEAEPQRKSKEKPEDVERRCNNSQIGQ